MDRFIRIGLCAAVLARGRSAVRVRPRRNRHRPTRPRRRSRAPPSPPTILDPNVRPIDLNTALRLAGVQNPQLLIARQRVVEAAALRQLAAVQILPSINLGMNYDSHTGNLQQSNGNILSVNRSALYVGAGAGAVAAGTVVGPGRRARRERRGRGLRLPDLAAGRGAAAVRLGGGPEPDVPARRRWPTPSCSGPRAAGPSRVQVRDEAKRVAELTAAYANAGQGRAGRRPPGADRAGVARERRPGGRGGDPRRPRPGSATS